jgi:hypothetical protein
MAATTPISYEDFRFVRPRPAAWNVENGDICAWRLTVTQAKANVLDEITGRGGSGGELKPKPQANLLAQECAMRGQLDTGRFCVKQQAKTEVVRRSVIQGGVGLGCLV